jgi:hypothetical protein
MKSLQDERKRDVEETAEFINQLLSQNKLDSTSEVNKIMNELDFIRRDMNDRVPVTDLEQTKTRLADQIESKVELNEVQTALNECQKDIVSQLNEFK